VAGGDLVRTVWNLQVPYKWRSYLSGVESIIFEEGRTVLYGVGRQLSHRILKIQIAINTEADSSQSTVHVVLK
jgi:hypothetical protein